MGGNCTSRDKPVLYRLSNLFLPKTFLRYFEILFVCEKLGAKIRSKNFGQTERWTDHICIAENVPIRPIRLKASCIFGILGKHLRVLTEKRR